MHDDGLTTSELDPERWSTQTAARIFDRLLGDFPDGVILFDEQMRFVRVNEVFAEITGYTLDELGRLRLADLLDEPAAEVDERVGRFFAEGRQRETVPIRTKAGERRLVSYTIRADMIPGRHIAFARDITEELELQQQQGLRARALDTLEVAVYVVGRDDRITLWNRAAAEITGFSAAEAIGSTVEELGIAPPEELAAARERIRAAKHTARGPDDPRPKPFQLAGLRRRKDGRIFSGTAEVTPLGDEQSGLVGTLVMLQDHGREQVPPADGEPAADDKLRGLLFSVAHEVIDDPTPAELLEFAIRRLRACLQVDLVASWRVDARAGKLVLEAGSGWEGDWPELPLDGPDCARVIVEAPAAFEGGGPWQAGGALDRAGVRSGAAAPLLGHGHRPGVLAVYSREPRRFSGDEIEALGAVAELVGGSRARVRLDHVEGALELARRQASLGALLAGVAHDFNNMLSVILGYARLMRTEAEGSELLSEGVAEIEAAAQRSVDLSRSLVDLSRPTPAQPDLLEVDAILTEVVSLMHRTLGDTIELRTDLGSEGAMAMLSRGELDRAIVNLVANARDALVDGGSVLVRSRLLQSAGAEAGEPSAVIVIEVIDDGPGMPASVLGQVLDPYFTTKPSGEGTGIGLPLVETIVGSAGGRFQIDSVVGRGTTARIRLPVAASETAD